MSVASALAAIELSSDHVARGHRRGFHVGALLRTSQTKAGETIRDLQLVLSMAMPDDPNRELIEALIEALG